jgi:hypothetical protein
MTMTPNYTHHKIVLSKKTNKLLSVKTGALGRQTLANVRHEFLFLFVTSMVLLIGSDLCFFNCTMTTTATTMGERGRCGQTRKGKTVTPGPTTLRAVLPSPLHKLRGSPGVGAPYGGPLGLVRWSQRRCLDGGGSRRACRPAPAWDGCDLSALGCPRLCLPSSPLPHLNVSSPPLPPPTALPSFPSRT